MTFEKLTNSLWALQISGWTIYFILMFLTYMSVDSPNTLQYLFMIKFQRSLTGLLLTSLLWQYYKRAFDFERLGKNVLIIFICSMLLGPVWRMTEMLFFQLTLDDYNFTNAMQYTPRQSLIYGVTIMAWSAIGLGILYWQQWQREREKSHRANLLAEKARLDALRYQVNPHFLFNAMNSIRASIDEDKERAKLMVTQLSEFMRHSLLSGEKKEIPLRDELDAVKNYLAIEKTRFEDDLQIEFDIDENTKGELVPCFILNPLVENSIKHGFETSPRPLQIKISAKMKDGKLSLEVQNTGKIAETNGSMGIGLANVQERIATLFPETGKFELSSVNGHVIAKVEI